VTAIVGVGMVGPSEDLGEPLELMIFNATAAALADAGMGSDDYGLVCLAASDLFDGRGISTMTLTESTGSMGKWEQRVCNDGLVALDLAIAHIHSGYVRDNAVVASWHKGSDVVSPGAIASAAVDPLHRDLGIAPDAFAALSSGVAVLRDHPSAARMRDVAVALVVTANAEATGPRILGHRRATAGYLRQQESPSQRLQALLNAACADARLVPTDLDLTLLTGVLAAGVAPIELPVSTVILAETAGVGYAAGLLGVVSLRGRPPGRYAVCGADSIGSQELAVTILEKRR
jgi:hypothetical protein